MNWYVSKIVFRIICGEGSHKPQFDEQLRLILACDKKDAFEKIKELAQTEQETFQNNNQVMVQWKFINITALYKLDEFISGAELYSRIEEYENGEAYEDIINKKATGILTNSSLEILNLA